MMNAIRYLHQMITYFDNMEQATTTLKFSNNFECFVRGFCNLPNNNEKRDCLSSEYIRFSVPNFVDIVCRTVMALSVNMTIYIYE